MGVRMLKKHEVDVICIGNAAIDVPLKPVDERVFEKDSTPIDRIVPTIGGSGTNVSTIVSRLGCRVALMTLLGKDIMGEYILSHCRENHVDTSSVVMDDKCDTPLSVGLVRQNGERTFVVSKGSSTFRLNANHIDYQRFKQAKLLTIASIFINPLLDNDGLVRIFKAARKSNLIICADMMKSRDGKKLVDIKEALSYLDYFFPNYDEASDLTDLSDVDEIADVLLGAGIKTVVIKQGKNGCYVINSHQRMHVPALVNPVVVDTIGAGDNFVAGFITAILDGLSLDKCAQFANAVASISVGAVGSTGGVVSKQQIMEILETVR